MTVHRWEGTATALSSVMHGGETLGTITYLRREAFLTAQGRITVPVISGNGVRGLLRDIGARLTWEALGEPDLPTPVLHALWSGGSLVKAKTKPLTGERLAHLRSLVPHVGVFGAAGGGRILDSALDVGKLLPVCAQLQHLLPADLRDNGTLPDIHDLLQIERYSRTPSAGAVPTPSTDNATAPTDDAATDEPDGLMRYGTETFIAGTQFHCWFALRHPTAPELEFFTEVLNAYTARPHVGGKSARGHGVLALNLNHATTAPTPTPGQPPEHGSWRKFHGHPHDEVIEALRWLD